MLSQLTSATLGEGAAYFIVQLATVLLLVLAANTSFGGLPTLFRVLASDHFLPHRFARRSAHDVYRWGVLTLSGTAAVLLVAAGGQMNTLVPLFAIGVFVGFSLAQAGMVLHWRAEHPDAWVRRALPNLLGAVATTIAALVTTAMKFADGAWLIAVAIAVLVPTMAKVRQRYGLQDAVRQAAELPSRPIHRRATVAVVPVKDISEVTRRALETALSMSADATVAVHVGRGRDGTRALERAWSDWGVDVPLVLLDGDDGDVATPIADYIERRLRQPRGPDRAG